MADCNPCKQEQRITALEKDAKHNSMTHKEFFGRFEDIGKEMTAMGTHYIHIQSDLTSIKTTLQEIKDTPNKRWETVLTVAITAIIGGAISYFLFGA